MKKIILFMSMLLVVGCSLSNSPRSKVEELFTKYNMLDRDIKDEIGIVVTNADLTDEQQTRYRKLIEDQYKNLVYEIKDEEIDGDTAIVTTQIEVMDYKRVINELDSDYLSKDNYTKEEYNNDKLENLESNTDKVTYTLELEVIKDEDGKWRLDDLSEVDIKKIQGMY